MLSGEQAEFTLYGNSVNSQCCVLKLAMLEKGVPFESVTVYTQEQLHQHVRTHFGRVPVLSSQHGVLTRFEPILEFLEDAFPGSSFYPPDPYVRAEVRLAVVLIDEYFSNVTQPLYKETVFNEKLSEETKERLWPRIEQMLSFLQQYTISGPYLLGDEMTYADFSAAINFPLSLSAIQQVYKVNVLTKLPQVQRYIDTWGQNENVQAIWRDGAKALIAASLDRNAKKAYLKLS